MGLGRVGSAGIAVGIAVAIAGCGGGSAASPAASVHTSTAESLSRAEYISQGDRLCAIHQQKRAALARNAASGESDPLKVIQADVVLDRKLYDDLDSLAKPAADNDILISAIAGARQGLDLVTQAWRAQRKGDFKNVATLFTRAKALKTSSDQKLREYGFTVCGKK